MLSGNIAPRARVHHASPLRAPGSGLRAPGSGLRAPGSGLRAYDLPLIFGLEARTANLLAV